MKGECLGLCCRELWPCAAKCSCRHGVTCNPRQLDFMKNTSTCCLVSQDTCYWMVQSMPGCRFGAVVGTSHKSVAPCACSRGSLQWGVK